MPTKLLTFPTNFNNKLSCNAFVHIDKAPGGGLPESKLPEFTIEISTNDNSHPMVKCQLVDLLRIPLGQLVQTSIVTWPSHGMDGVDFYNWFVNMHQEANAETPVAIYYYKKKADENDSGKNPAGDPA